VKRKRNSWLLRSVSQCRIIYFYHSSFHGLISPAVRIELQPYGKLV
jgi:hypothetical protein